MTKLTYQNPVWNGYFADPFVLKVDQTYYAYGTGPAASDGREFPVLRSVDLVHWEPLGGALLPLEGPRANNYWAPEVTQRYGNFLLFYSASTSASDADQRLRLAIADDPAGPFKDSGRLLLPQTGFSIDANPFVDPHDGKAYLFFATDFDRDEPTGTGLCVVPLSDDMMCTDGAAKMVLRASAPWQVYEANRNYKGRLWPKWNCVEGPAVVFHERKYYCFYSGGAWHGTEYGVGVAVADHPMGPWHDENAGRGPTVLKGVPGKVVGPGHCSVIAGPDRKHMFMIYHAWDAQHTARRMCIDPIVWTESGPRVDGPSTQRRDVCL